MTRWPWISILISLVLMLNPIGFEIVRSAFFAAEGLARGIWGPIALTIFAIMATAIVAEWLIRTTLIRRRTRGATS